MTLNVIYDGNERAFPELSDGFLFIRSQPFLLNYYTLDSHAYHTDEASSVETKTSAYTVFAPKSLDEIDYLLAHVFGEYKIMIIDGRIFFDDEPLEKEYFL